MGVGGEEALGAEGLGVGPVLRLFVLGVVGVFGVGTGGY